MSGLRVFRELKAAGTADAMSICAVANNSLGF